MKKRIVVLLLASALALPSCGNSSPSDAPTNTSGESENVTQSDESIENSTEDESTESPKPDDTILAEITPEPADEEIKDPLGLEDVPASEPTTDTDTAALSEDEFVSEISLAIADAINSSDESIYSVLLQDGDLRVCVTLGDPSPLTYEDLMLSRTSSITDEILSYADCFDLWETITIDFGEHGYIKNGHDNIQGSGNYCYFASENFVIQK